MPNNSASGGFLTPVSTAPLNDAGLDAIFQQLIVGLTGLPGALVRPRWQPVVPKQPERGVDWCAIGVTVLTTDANPGITHDGAADGGLGQDQFSRHQEIDLLATFYGPNAGNYAAQVQDGLTIPQNNELLQLNLLVYVNSSTIRQLPELLNEQWVKRFDLPLRFRRQVKRTYSVQNLVSAAVDVTRS